MTNKQKKLILGTSIVFILLRLVFAYVFKDSFFERGNRHTSINQIAMNLLENGTFGLSVGNPSAANEPIYTSFIAFSYWLFGTNWFGPAFLQSLILGFNAFLIYLLTFELWANKRLSFLALVAVNMYPFYFTQSISVSDTVFYTGLLALSMYLSKKSMESRKIFLGYYRCCMGLVTINPFLRYKHFWNGTTLSIPVSWLELFTTVINNWCNYADNSLALVLPKLYPYRGIFFKLARFNRNLDGA